MYHVGVGVLSTPPGRGIACSAFNELIVTDTGHRCIRVFSADGDLAMTFGDGLFTGVAVHGCTVVATQTNSRPEECFVFS